MRAAGGMGSDHRFRAHRDGVIERLVGNMRNIDNHADGIHFANYLLAEIGEAIVHRRAGGRVGPVVIAKVRERHREDAHAPVHAQYGQVVVDLMAAFDGEYSGDFFLADDALYVTRASGKLYLVRMLIEDALHGIAQIEGPANGFWAVVIGWNPEREKWDMNAALAQARDVEHAVGQMLRDIDMLDEHALRSVIVAVDAEHAGLYAMCLVELLGETQRSESEDEQKQGIPGTKQTSSSDSDS